MTREIALIRPGQDPSMTPLESMNRVESRARTYAATFEAVFEHGDGLKIRDSSGREFLDCLSCAGALPLGHNNPEVREAVLRFVSSGHVQQVLDLTTPAKIAFVEQLFAALPEKFAARAKIQFCSPSGSDAVEAAMKLARYATKRRPIIAFHGAYHGMTGGALAAMGNLVAKSGIGLDTCGIHFAPYPYRYRCPFGTDGTQTDELSASYLRTLLHDPDGGVPKPAAVIVEVVQGEGGCIPASDHWLRSVREMTRELEIPLIVDEVQSGFGRTGTMFAFERAGITPDIVVLSKALGGGYPLAVVVYDQSLDLWPRGMHVGTFRGNQIAMVAGKVTTEIILRDRLALQAAERGAQLRAGLRQIASLYPVFGDVRGRGLMLGAEIVKPGVGNSQKPADGDLAKSIQLAAFRNGLLIEAGGRNGAVIRLIPPLTITRGEVSEVLERLQSAVVAVLSRPRDHVAN